MKPVDIETPQGVEMEMAKSGEHSVIEAGDSPKTIQALESESPEMKTNEGAEAVGTQSSGEDTSPKGVKSDGSPEGTTKKKSKRRPRSLFKRNSRNIKDEKKVEDACGVTKESETQEENSEASSCVNNTKEQVVCDESEKPDEIRDQSDAEYDIGEASEGEALEEKSDEQSEVATNATAEGQTDDEKKSEQKQGTKRKGFFKRGLSLRRSKSKKKQEDSEPKTLDNPTTKETETCEIGVLTDSGLEQNATQEDNDEVNNGELSSDVKEINEVKSCEILDEAKTEAPENVPAIVKKGPTKPVRKVSFVEPEFVSESSDEGDSPSEATTETGDDLQDSTPPVTAEVAPSAEVTIVISEPVVDPKDVSADENPTTEVDDDDELTEVSSVSSSLLASSDVISQVDTDVTEDTQLSVYTDTEETGSRITLVESGEVGEGSESKPEDVSETKPEDEVEKDNISEGDKLLGDRPKEKDGEWELLNQSYDMSVELSRVRKQTLFNVKRLCCSVM